MKPKDEILANIKRNFILEVLKNNKRIDGRGFYDYRKIEIKTGVIKKAEGSALVKIGNTEVLAGVKLSLGTPYPDTPNEGALIVTTELIPLASAMFEPGPPDENSIELSRVVDRALREGEVLDLEKLCIVEGEKVWLVYVDIYTLNYDGNLFDACCLAAVSALLDARFPKLEDDRIIYEEKTNIRLPVKNYPLEVTYAKIGDYIVLDPCYEEEEVMDARITFGIKQDDTICAIQKGGRGSFKPDEILKLYDNAVEKARYLRSFLKF